MTSCRRRGRPRRSWGSLCRAARRAGRLRPSHAARRAGAHPHHRAQQAVPAGRRGRGDRRRSRRVEAPCRYAGDCGGCDFQHVSPAGQRRLLTAVVREQLDRLAGLTWEARSRRSSRTTSAGAPGSRSPWTRRGAQAYAGIVRTRSCRSRSASSPIPTFRGARPHLGRRVGGGDRLLVRRTAPGHRRHHHRCRRARGRRRRRGRRHGARRSRRAHRRGARPSDAGVRLGLLAGAPGGGTTLVDAVLEAADQGPARPSSTCTPASGSSRPSWPTAWGSGDGRQRRVGPRGRARCPAQPP